jgi:anti-sigma regulatory factor (Ser/Thr protein kinase)
VPGITRAATIDNLDELMQFVDDCAHGHDFSDKRKLEIRLAVEEALMNIISHAYPEEPGDVEVACGPDEDGKMVVEISDSGIPFDPHSRTNPDVSSDIEDREIGGLGIMLIRKYIRDVRYRRDSDKNVLTLVIEQQ